MGEKTLKDLFHETLKDIYFAEKKILSTLPKMAKAAQSERLKAAFEKHESETEDHVARLEKVFAEMDEAPRGKTCDAIMGIIEEGQGIMKEFKVSLHSMPAYWPRLKLWSTMKLLDTVPLGPGPLSSASSRRSIFWIPRWRKKKRQTKP